MLLGVYYHADYVGDPRLVPFGPSLRMAMLTDIRDYKWINTIQLEKTVEQVSNATHSQGFLLSMDRCNSHTQGKPTGSGF